MSGCDVALMAFQVNEHIHLVHDAAVAVRTIALIANLVLQEKRGAGVEEGGGEKCCREATRAALRPVLLPTPNCPPVSGTGNGGREIKAS